MRLPAKLIFSALGIALVLGAVFFTLQKTPAAEFILMNDLPPPEEPAVFVPSVTLGKVRVPVAIADEGPEITRGLSGTLSLPKNEGMFFIFEKPDRYRFWMPDMHFPIDIIWIEEEKPGTAGSGSARVVGIAAEVSNEFDPVNPKFYLPPTPVRYVLEVNAGFAARNGIAPGTFVKIELSQG